MNSRGCVGLLHLQEHYRQLKVGWFLKNPLQPVWLCASQHHITGEGARSRLVSDVFLHLYYRGLANDEFMMRIYLHITFSSAFGLSKLPLFSVFFD